jgi:hypothetical protein
MPRTTVCSVFSDSKPIARLRCACRPDNTDIRANLLCRVSGLSRRKLPPYDPNALGGGVLPRDVVGGLLGVGVGTFLAGHIGLVLLFLHSCRVLKRLRTRMREFSRLPGGVLSHLALQFQPKYSENDGLVFRWEVELHPTKTNRGFKGGL